MRSLIGLLASQLLVLQFFLAGVVATQMAFQPSTDAFVICHGNGQDSSSQPDKPDAPVHHAACTICAFAAHAGTMPADTPQVVVLDALAMVVGNVTPLAIAPSEQHSPRTSQGPPLSA